MRKAVLRREGLVARFKSAIDNYADKIAPGFGQLMQPFLRSDETMPDIALVIRLLGRLIVSRFKNLLTLDRSHIDELNNDRRPRRRKDRLAALLYAMMVDIRRLADAAFDKEVSAELVPIDGRTPDTPRLLYRTGQHSMEKLRDPTLEPTAKISGITPEPEKWADALEPLVTDLGIALGVLEDERTKAKEKGENRKKGMKDFDFLYSHGVAILRGVLFLAGLPDPGKDLPTLSRVRRSTRGPDPREEQPRSRDSEASPPAEEPPSGDEPTVPPSEEDSSQEPSPPAPDSEVSEAP